MKSLCLLLLAFTFYSCEKEPYCWTCETTYRTTYSDNRPADTSSIKQPMCNYTDTEISDYEKAGTQTTTVVVGGVEQVVHTSVKCSH